MGKLRNTPTLMGAQMAADRDCRKRNTSPTISMEYWQDRLQLM
jgi:hypothetical protein